MIVYALKSLTTNKIYIGYTSNIEKRLERHNGIHSRKKSSYTYKQKGPWIVIYSETCDDITIVRKRERELKSAKGREFIKLYIRP